MNGSEDNLNEKILSLQEKVNALEIRLQEVHHAFDAHPIPIIVYDFDNKIRNANTRAIKLFQSAPDEVYHDDFLRNSLSKRDLKKWDRYKHELLQEDQVSFEIKLLAKNGKPLNVVVTSLKIFYQGNDCIVSYLKDITQQKLAEKIHQQEKEKYQVILDAIPALVFIKDTENRIISINKAYEEATGLSKEDVLGKRLFDLTEHQDVVEKCWLDDLEVIETGVAKRNIIGPLFTDLQKWFITDKIPFTSSGGTISGIIGFSMNVTDRKNAEEALIRSEKKFRLLVETAPDGIVLGNMDGKFLDANKAFLNMVGYSLSELTELSYQDIVPEKWIAEIKKRIEVSVKTGSGSGVMEMEYFTKDGSVIPVLVSRWVMLDENGKPFQSGAYVKDLTVLKKAEELEKELLQKDKDQLENDLAAKNRELNTKVTQLIETNELVNGVISKLNDILEIDNEDKNRQINFVIKDLLNRGKDDLWAQFEITFGQIHPSFYNDLYREFPNLTTNERKLCAFLKMNLSTKDISSITHQTIRSIEVARFRLRKKMDLPRSSNLAKYLSHF
ncbi:MAG: hypothetical protein B6I19_00455 [Bacteroidetes bacterium 4572_114]|nr:MAG: hypothetical protein B6I19_00455 [Bacteroidetes bacterium 4572_114]